MANTHMSPNHLAVLLHGYSPGSLGYFLSFPQIANVALGQGRHVDDTYDEGDEPFSELEGLVSLPGGGYSLSLSIPEVFFKYIIGHRGSTRSNIEKDTKCRLTVPQRGRGGDIGKW